MDALLTLVLVGSLMTAGIAMYLRLTAPRPEAVVVGRSDDIDAEFFRIIDREQLWDLHNAA